MKRPMSMVTAIIVILFASFIYFLRGLALAILGGVATKIGSQVGGNLTILSGVVMVISALCAWAFVDAIWNSKRWVRTYGLMAADLALLAVMLNSMQGATVHTEIIGVIVAVFITASLLVHSLRRGFRHSYQPVVAYSHS